MFPFDKLKIFYAYKTHAGEHLQRIGALAPTTDEVAIVKVGDQLQLRYIVLHRSVDKSCRNSLMFRCYSIIFWDDADGYYFYAKKKQI